MEKSQTAELLTIAAAVDPIAVTRLTVEAWHEVIGHLEYDAAREALREHRRTSAEGVRPAHILALVADQQKAIPRLRAKWESEE